MGYGGGPGGYNNQAHREVDQPRSWRQFGEMMGLGAQEMVFDQWGITDTSTQGGGGGGYGGRGGGGGYGTGGGGGTGGQSWQQRYDQLYEQRLQVVNDDLIQRGQPTLTQLPHDEEQRLAHQVDQDMARGGGGGFGGPGGFGQQQQPAPPPRSWREFGEQVGEGFEDMFESMYNIDIDDDDDRPGGAGRGTGTGSGTGSGSGRGTGGGTDHDGRQRAESGRPAIDPDDIDLEELTAKLYDRIRSKLRLELLLDRERAGLLSDFR